MWMYIVDVDVDVDVDAYVGGNKLKNVFRASGCSFQLIDDEMMRRNPGPASTSASRAHTYNTAVWTMDIVIAVELRQKATKGVTGKEN